MKRCVAFLSFFLLLAIPAFPYTHPGLGFSVDIPADWETVANPKDADLQLVPKNTTGVIQVASSESEGLMDPIIFANIWEMQYVGTDKVLKSKLLGEKINVADYPAFRGIYQGDDLIMETFCISVSGRVYLLSATFSKADFTNRQPEFENFAYSFRLAKPIQQTQKPVVTQEAPAAPPEKPKLPVSEDKRLANAFQADDAGYTIRFPSGWVFKKQSENTYIFSGKEGSQAYYSTINIQKLRSKKNGGVYADVDAVIEGFKKDFLSGDPNANFFDGKSFKYADKNVQLEGKQFKAEYTMQGERFRQWLVVVSDYTQEYFYAFSYTSPADQYDFFLWIAETMLETWRI